MFNRDQTTDAIGKLAYASLPGFGYRGRRGGSWFFFSPVENQYRPMFRWAVIAHSRKRRAFEVQLAASYFSEGGQACRAQRLSVSVPLGELSGRAYEYGSKRGYEKALEMIAADLGLYREEFFGKALDTLRDDEQVLEGLEFLEGCDTTDLEEVAAVRFGPDLGKELVIYLGLEAPAAEPEDEMSAFLAQLRSEGETASQGAFTLEAGKAREKLAQFQLQDPRAFVVHLVAGAVAHGSEQVRVYLDSDDLVVDFDGPPVGRGRLEQLFASLLSDDREQAPLRHWAVGLQGATTLGPRWLWFQSQDQTSSWRLTVEPDAHRVEEHPRLELPLVNRFHFRAPADLTAVGRFFSKLKGPLPEALHLRARCSLAPVRLSLNGEVLVAAECRGYNAYLLCRTEGLPWKEPLDLEHAGYSRIEEFSGATVLFGLSYTATGTVRFVVNGLHFGAPTLNWSPVFEMTVWLGSATTDLSQQNLVADVALLRLVKRLQEREEAFLVEILENFHQIESSHQELLAVRYLQLLLEDRLSERAEALLKELPIYGTVAGERLSLTQLGSMERVFYTHRSWEFPPLDGRPVVVVESGDLGRPLHRLFQVDSADPLLETAAGWHRRRLEWLSLPPKEPRLEPRPGRIAAVSLQGLQGELGLGSGTEQLEILSSGRPLPLASHYYRWLPRGLSLVVEADGLEANDDWTDIRPGPTLEKVIELVENSLAGFFLGLSENLEAQAVRDGLINYLGWLAHKGKRHRAVEELPIFEVQDGLLNRRRVSLQEVRDEQLEVRGSPVVREALTGLKL